MADGYITVLWIARAIGDEKSVPLKSIEIVVPRNPNQFYTAINETAKDIVFHTTIHQHDLLFSVAIVNHFLAADYRDLVLLIRIRHWK